MPRPRRLISPALNFPRILSTESAMQSAKQEVAALLARLPEGSSLEDVQYHLYVIKKIRRGLQRAHSEGALSHAQAEARLDKWLIKS